MIKTIKRINKPLAKKSKVIKRCFHRGYATQKNNRLRLHLEISCGLFSEKFKHYFFSRSDSFSHFSTIQQY